MAPRRWLVPRRSAFLLVALAALVAGCQDYATAPALPSAATHGSAPGTGGAAVISSPYTCFTSIATPGGQFKYRYGRLQLKFPTEALAPDGSTTRYRYRGYASGAVLDRMADCVIPRSAVAVEMMHRRFGVHDKLMKKGGGSSDGGVTIMDTQIDGIVITACQYGGEYPNNCNPPPPPTGYQEDPNPPATECSTYCDPWSDDGNGSGDGTPLPQPTMAEDDSDDTGPHIPNCSRPANNQQQAYCSGWEPDEAQRRILNESLDRIAAKGGYCATIAQAGRDLLATANAVHLYSNWNGSGNIWPFDGAAPLGGHWMIIADYYATGARPPSMTDWVLAHELDHHLRQVNNQTDPDGHLKNPDGSSDKFHTPHSHECSGT